MGEITTLHYLVLAAGLFMIGTLGVLTRRNVIIILMSIELILNAVNLNLVAFSRLYGLHGQIFAIFVITDAAAEAAVGLGIIIAFFRNKETVNVDEIDLLGGRVVFGQWQESCEAICEVDYEHQCHRLVTIVRRYGTRGLCPGFRDVHSRIESESRRDRQKRRRYVYCPHENCKVDELPRGLKPQSYEKLRDAGLKASSTENDLLNAGLKARSTEELKNVLS